VWKGEKIFFEGTALGGSRKEFLRPARNKAPLAATLGTASRFLVAFDEFPPGQSSASFTLDKLMQMLGKPPVHETAPK